MNRLYCFALAVLTFVLTSYLVGQSVRGLSPAEMNTLRGGNGQTAKWTTRCDQYANVYVGCTKAGDFCQRCVEENSEHELVSTMVDFLNNPNPEHLGGDEFKSGVQDCGNLWMGSCVADPNAPGGFRCDMSDMGLDCPTEFRVGLQPDWAFSGNDQSFRRSQSAQTGA